jgi:hypothetical protein
MSFSLSRGTPNATPGTFGEDASLEEVKQRLRSLRDYCLTNLAAALEGMSTGDLTVEVTAVTTPIDLATTGEGMRELVELFNGMLAKAQRTIVSYNTVRQQLARSLGEHSGRAPGFARQGRARGDPGGGESGHLLARGAHLSRRRRGLLCGSGHLLGRGARLLGDRSNLLGRLGGPVDASAEDRGPQHRRGAAGVRHHRRPRAGRRSSSVCRVQSGRRLSW